MVQAQQSTVDLHHAVRDVMEEELTSPDFVVGIAVQAGSSASVAGDLHGLARRVDAWLSSLDPDTDDSSALRTTITESAVTVNVHAIPRDAKDRRRRARPIVWNAEPMGGPSG